MSSHFNYATVIELLKIHWLFISTQYAPRTFDNQFQFQFHWIFKRCGYLIFRRLFELLVIYFHSKQYKTIHTHIENCILFICRTQRKLKEKCGIYWQWHSKKWKSEKRSNNSLNWTFYGRLRLKCEIIFFIYLTTLTCVTKRCDTLDIYEQLAFLTFVCNSCQHYLPTNWNNIWIT